MGGLNFSRAQCLRSFRRLGFTLGNKRQGKHDKFFPPQEISERLVGNQPRFIMVPRHDFHCQSEIIAELKAMGGEKLVEEFRRHL